MMGIRLLACILALLLGLLPGAAWAVEIPPAKVSGWNYTLDHGAATITGVMGRNPAGILIIPDKVDGFMVTAISVDAFIYCENLYGVVIPEGVKSVGNSAFQFCAELATVALPQSMASIGRQAFLSCHELKNIELPEGLLSIGNMAFSSTALTRIMIPGSVEDIRGNPFSEAYSLAHIDTHSQNPVYGSIAGVLFDKQQKVLVSYPNAKEGKYAIPEGILIVGDSAFSGCKELSDLLTPESVISIGYSAFSGCESLTDVTILGDVLSIGQSAFSGCSRLTSMVIPTSVTSIGRDAFYGCPNLTLTVTKGSYAEQYAKENKIPYKYSVATRMDANVSPELEPTPTEKPKGLLGVLGIGARNTTPEPTKEPVAASSTQYTQQQQGSMGKISYEDAYSIVATGRLNAYPEKSIFDAFSSFLNDWMWETYHGGDGFIYVDVEGDYYIGDDMITAWVQFKVFGDGTFDISDFELDGEAQSIKVLNAFLETVFE